MDTDPLRSFPAAADHAELRFVIGVDGGGSGTRARLATRSGAVIGNGDAGPSALGQGIETALANVRHAISLAFVNAGVPVPAPAACALGLGLAGAHLPARCEAFVRAAPRFGRLVLDTDAYTALLGAHRGQPGAIVAAGTGSIGEALCRDGRRLFVSGWGFPVGDEGSGAWLGLRAMREAQRALDGRAQVGPLVRAVWRAAGSTRETLLDWCEHAGQNAYAQLAPLVFECAHTDPWADAQLDNAARALENIAAALDPDATLPLVITGSIGQRLAPRIAAATRARCVVPAGDALDGALYLIRQAIGEPKR